MSNEKPNDPLDLAGAFKQIADAWSEGMEQAKRQSDCKMRRFFLASTVSSASLPNRHDGAVFPSGDVVVYDSFYKNIQVFPSLDVYTDHYARRGIKWIDPEVTP